MHIDLKSILLDKEIELSDYDEYLSQREKYGISDFDLGNFIEYIDDIIYVGLSKLVFSESFLSGKFIGPEYMSHNAWKDLMQEAYELSSIIHRNNEKEVLIGIKDFNYNVDLYTDFINNLKAESYASRERLFTILNDYNEYIKVFL